MVQRVLNCHPALGLSVCRAAALGGALSRPIFPSALWQWHHHPAPPAAFEQRANPKALPETFCKNKTHFPNGGKCQNGHTHHQISSQRGISPLMRAILSCYGEQLSPGETLSGCGGNPPLLLLLSDGGPHPLGVPDLPLL